MFGVGFSLSGPGNGIQSTSRPRPVGVKNSVVRTFVRSTYVCDDG
jgi:hypothetical protein